MISAAQIADLRTASADYEETERFKSKLARLRRERNPLFLTAGELGEILRWKLGGQYHRRCDLYEANTDDVVRTVRPAAAEEELHRRHRGKFGKLPKYVRVT
jgi:hypothetical protein